MSPYTSRQERKTMVVWLHRYSQSAELTKDFTLLRYTRLMRWLKGDTFGDIAKDEGVTAQAISQSVQRDYKTIKRFALENNKDYAGA